MIDFNKLSEPPSIDFAQDPLIAVVIPYYNQPLMLREHLRRWFDEYPSGVLDYMRLIIVDDGSQKARALEVIEHLGLLKSFLDAGHRLYRITNDIPWNRGGARNLGSIQTNSTFLLHMDIDHVMPIGTAAQLPAYAGFQCNKRAFWRFPRFRRGAADATRQKDALNPACEYGLIKPHIDSYLIKREFYWAVGGYDERYSGCLGGGTPFLKQLEHAFEPKLAPDFLPLEVYTSHAISDANADLDRTPGEFQRRQLSIKKHGNPAERPVMFNFSWERQI